MADDEESQPNAQTEQNETILVFRAIWISDKSGILIQKSCSRLFERDPVLSLIAQVLPVVPFETNALHADSVITL